MYVLIFLVKFDHRILFFFIWSEKNEIIWLPSNKTHYVYSVFQNVWNIPVHSAHIHSFSLNILFFFRLISSNFFSSLHFTSVFLFLSHYQYQYFLSLIMFVWFIFVRKRKLYQKTNILQCKKEKLYFLVSVSVSFFLWNVTCVCLSFACFQLETFFFSLTSSSSSSLSYDSDKHHFWWFYVHTSKPKKTNSQSPFTIQI